MTEEQMKVILKVSSKIASKYRIPGYEKEDIEQQCFLLAMDAMKRYNEELPLENFLMVHLRNRIINFRRDNYLRKSILSDAEPLFFSLSEIVVDDDTLVVDKQELLDKIDDELPQELREDYLRLLDGATIPTKRKRKLLQELRKICQSEESVD